MIYFVATPIGNLEDITIRALRVLEQSDIIYCEDTRNTSKLLNHYDIKTKLYSYHKFNEKSKILEILNLARNGKDISIVSDAGMPVISDPGNILVNSIIDEGLEYTVLPGPTAFATALVLSGFDNEKFTFLGFCPTKNKEKREFLDNIFKSKSTQIFYESPHRIMNTLGIMAEIFPKRRVAVIRELTKIFEDVKIFLAEDFNIQNIVEKGEIVVIVDKNSEVQEINDDFILKKLEELKSQGFSSKMAVKEVSKNYKISKNRVYELSLKN